MRPNVAALRLTTGSPQLKWFSRLNDSSRSSRRCGACRGMIFEIARSTFQYAGPTTALRGRLPSVPGPGCANAARLN